MRIRSERYAEYAFVRSMDLVEVIFSICDALNTVTFKLRLNDKSLLPPRPKWTVYARSAREARARLTAHTSCCTATSMQSPCS